MNSLLNNSLNYLCKVVPCVFFRSENQICFEIAQSLLLPKLSCGISTPTGLSKVPDWLEWLVRNQKYALIQCSFSYHKRCYRMIAIRRRKRQAQLKAKFLIPFAWFRIRAKRNSVLTGTYALQGKHTPTT